MKMNGMELNQLVLCQKYTVATVKKIKVNSLRFDAVETDLWDACHVFSLHH